MSRATTVFQFDDVLVDLANEQVLKSGQPALVEPKAFRVLVYLLENRGRLVEKDELLTKIWPDTFVTENALTREIGLLRKALGDSIADAKYIETVPTRGYRFIAKVAARSAEAPGATDSASAAALLGRSADTPSSAARDARGDSTPRAASGSFLKVITKRAVILPVAGILLAVALFLALRVFLGPAPQSRAGRLPQQLNQVQLTSSPGIDIFPSFSPDGSTIAYSSDMGGSFEIYLRQLAPGGRTIQLTNDGAENLQPAWSPDGKTIAYYSQAKGSIWIIPALGGVGRQLTEFGSGPSWSPDGMDLVFQSDGIRDLSATANVSVSGSTLWTLSLRDGSTRQITRPDVPSGAHNSPSWSPDGKRIVFVTSYGADEGEVWTVSRDGKEERRIAANGGFYNPVYARNGRVVYVAAARGGFGILALSVSDKNQAPEDAGTLILNSAPSLSRYLAISPDGEKIAYSNVTTSSNLASIPISAATSEAAGSPVPLTNDTRFRKTSAEFSPDGRRILFNVHSANEEAGVWIMDSDGKQPALAASSCIFGRWLPGGKDLICLSEGSQEPGLLSVHLETGRSTRMRDLPDDATFLSVSPDGKQLAFNSKKSGALNVWIASLAGGKPRQLTFDSEGMGFTCWSADGKYLAFEMKRGDNTHIAIVPSSGGAPLQLTSEPGQSWAHSWSPDGDKIAFAALRNGVWNIRWVSMKSKRQEQVTQYRGSDHYVRYPAWSPLGNQIVYEYGETTANIWLLEMK